MKIDFKNLCVEYIDEKTLECYPPSSVISDKGMRASFTKVFDQGSPQNEVFDEIAQPMVRKLLDGRSGPVFENSGPGRPEGILRPNRPGPREF